MTLRPFILPAAFLLSLTACQAARLNPPVDDRIAADRNVVVDDTELVVVTPSPSKARSLVRKANPLGYAVLERDTLTGLGLTMLTIQIPNGQDGASAIRELEALEPGITAGVNHAYSPQQAGRSNPTSSREYAPGMLRWPQTGCAAHMAIGVLDSKLVGPSRRTAVTTDFSRRTATERAMHGTQVVTLLTAPGMLKSPRIFHADIVSPTEGLGDVASVDTMLRGLNWMVAQDVRLVNVSMAGPYNKILDRGFASAQRAGVVVVAPAGNAGPGATVRYPAAFRSTIAVTAIDAQQRIYRKSVRGSRIDFSAPGVDVMIKLPATKTYVSGTSFAAPFVTARIAADPALQRTRDPSQIRQRLMSGARDLGARGHDPVFGNGLIQAPPGCSD